MEDSNGMLCINRVFPQPAKGLRQTGATVDVLLVGALALQAYGYQDRLTRDVDAEVVGSVEALAGFFSRHQLPADLTENFSGWSIVAMPPGYRERATDLVHQSHLRVRLLARRFHYREAASWDRSGSRGCELYGYSI
jgi:hypothetical protein